MSKRRRLQNYIFQRFEVTIDAISARGWGQGTYIDGDQKVPVEVRGAVVGDRVVVEGRRIEDSILQCVCIEVVSTTYPRIASTCPHSAIRCNKNTGCGGCTLRQWAYDTQCQMKRDILLKMLAKEGIDSPVEPIIPCQNLTYYRNKMELSFGPNGAEEIGVGLHPSGFRYEVIDMQYCDMLSPLLPDLAQKTTIWARQHGVPYFKFRENSGFLRLLTLRVGSRTSETMVILTTTGVDSIALADGSTQSAISLVESFENEVLKQLSQPIGSFYWSIINAQKGRQTEIIDHLRFGSPVLHEKMVMTTEDHALHYEILPHAFFQPNTLQAEVLYRTVLSHAKGHMAPKTPVLDLYCGTGTIALSFAIHGHKAIAIDIEKQAIENARENARNNRLESQIDFYAGDTADILKKLLDEHADFSDYLLVIDPPRRGLLPTAYRQIMRMRQKTIIYVSCNPESLAEDLKKFSQDGYKIEKIQPVDMLPHTAHLETVVTLIRT